MRVNVRATAAVAAALIGAAVAAPGAFGDSGTISGAPSVVPGQQNYGNLASVSPDRDRCSNAYWLLPEMAGDHIAINWEAQTGNTFLRVYPSGTTDYTVDSANSIASQNLNNNNRNQLTFQTTSDGTLPVAFSSCDSDPGGPYDFNVVVVHSLVATLAGVPAALSGTATINVASPDGMPLGPPIVGALQYSAKGIPWTTIGQAGASGGVASVPYALPAALAGMKVSFRAVGSGAGYTTVTSAAQTLTLPAAAPTPPPAPAPVSSPSKATTTLKTKFYSVKGHGLPAIKAKLVVHWRYKGAITNLTGISVEKFPGRARLTIECLGRSCPTQPIRVRGRTVRVPVRIAVSRRGLPALARRLRHAGFAAGDKIRFSISLKHHRTAVALAQIRRGQPPLQLH